MKLKCLQLAVVLLLGIHFANAQGVYGISQHKISGENYFTQIDTTTGTSSIITFNPLGCGVAQGIYTIDKQGGRFFFLAPGDSLFTIDILSGNYLQKVKNISSDTFQHIAYAYHCLNNTLYALAQNKQTGLTYLSTVDPYSGLTSILSVNPISLGVAQGVYVIDPGFNRMIILGAADTLFTVDLSTGNLISKFRNSLFPDYNTIALEYNSQNGGLYGLLKNGDYYFLASIDPLSGTSLLISSIGMNVPFAQALTTIDAITNTMYLVTSGDSIHRIDLTTGDYSFRIKNNLSDSFFNVAIEANNSCLTSIKTTGLATLKNLTQYNLEVYPNPIQQQSLVIKSDKTLKAASISIYNSLGVLINQWNNLSGNNLELSQLNLDAGVYFIYVKEKDKIITTQKIIK